MTFKLTESFVQSALQAVTAAGSIITDAWDKPRTITHKGRIDLVTETDVAVENDLKRRLHEILPEAGFLAEESAAGAPLGELTWIIDPVDGTTNFAHGIPFVASSVGLWHRDRVVLGIVNAPVLGECYHAVRGGGAYVNGKPLHVSATQEPEQAVIAIGFPYSIQEDVDEVMRRLRAVVLATQGVRRNGAAALDLAYVAAGRCDAFYEIRLNPWDTSAGWLLVEEAGGRVGNLDTGGPYDLYARGILATNGHLHDAMQHILDNA